MNTPLNPMLLLALYAQRKKRQDAPTGAPATPLAPRTLH